MMWGDQSRAEYRAIMLGLCLIVCMVIMGIIFPLFETIMNAVWIGAVLIAVGTYLSRRISDAIQMYEALHAKPEQLKRKYPHD